jgi:outer membrane autotransporter protein
MFSNPDETLNVSATGLGSAGVFFNGGSNNLNFLSGGTTTLSGGWGAQGVTFFSLLANASVVSDAILTDATSSIGSMMTIAGSQLVLNQSFHADNQVLNQGAIAIAPGATLSSAAFVGDGHYVIGVTDPLTHGRIAAVAGAGSIDFTGASFQVALTDPSSMFVAGTNIQIAEDMDNAAIAGVTNGTVLVDNSALLNFLLYRGDAAEVGLTSDLLFAQVQIGLLADIAGEADDPNSIALGAALDAIGLNGDADLDDLMLALALLPTNEDINEVLDALLPETDGIAYDVATDLGDQALDVASKRLDALLADRLDGSYRVASIAPLALRGSVSDSRAGGRFWMQAFGRAVDQSQHSYNTGYDAGSYGVAVGADTNVDKATALGAAFSYTSTDAGGNGVNLTDTKVDSYQLTLYGDHLFDNALYAKGLLAYGWHANDIIRHDVGGIPGNTATGSYDADHVAARVELGRAYRGGDALTLVPRVHLNAAWYSPDGYAEQGVGGLGLVVGPEDLTSLRLGLGLLARWDIALSGGELFRPELRIDYRRDLTQPRFETAAEFLGAPGIVFRTQGVEPAADILNLGVGALLATAGGVDLRASYDLELKDDYTAHAGYVRASIPF